jgi:predicted DNA-binding helix-hairpin-helix protein
LIELCRTKKISPTKNAGSMSMICQSLNKGTRPRIVLLKVIGGNSATLEQAFGMNRESCEEDRAALNDYEIL